ncbi:hypothetical protein [Actinophytocola xanthii]|uniref:hypothetical protein n=1 Tax=Actinophytocola xanthii TaxID=1912961 RepID=UPI0011779C47|nr:hypothetical protein [Actinophytocola xanthii]
MNTERHPASPSSPPPGPTATPGPAGSATPGPAGPADSGPAGTAGPGPAGPDADAGSSATPPPSQAGWGAPPPPPEHRPRWSTRRTIAAIAIALGIAAAGGVAIYAASGSTEDPTAGPGGGGPGRNMVMAGPRSDLTHGEFQNGEVTAISDDSITAKSEDGYERTYVIDEDTEMSGDIAEGDEVMIVATTDGDTASAVTIAEAGVLPKPQDGNGGPPVMKNPNDN